MNVFLQRILCAVPLLLGSGLALLFWLDVPVSDQELLANFAKAGDFWSAIASVGAWPWWSPHFLQGTSLAPAWSYMLSNVVMLSFTALFGFLHGSKVAVVASLLGGATGMFFFLRRWSGDERAAWIGASLFLLSPAVLTRAAGFEHFVVVVSLSLLPWVLWALVGFIRDGTARSAIILSVFFSALALAYGKTGLMALPALGVFGLVAFQAAPRALRPGWRLLALAAAMVTVLAVIPNLPALREAGFVAMFDLGPFDGWQRAFSSKSALSWFDRDGLLGAGMDPGFAPTTLNGGTYMGVVLAAVLAMSLLRPATLHATAEGRAAKLLLALALGSFWISFGPRSVIGGHFELLRMSPGAADFTPALAWLLLAAQVWAIFRLVPSSSLPWRWAATGIALAYLFVPGFRLLEWLPLYRDIRAPFDFYQITGTIFLIGAVALTAGTLLRLVSQTRMRRLLAATLVCLAGVDASVYARPFFTHRMDRAVWADFLAAQEFLKTAPVEGRVYPFSGRYFYLMTPWLSGRPLAAEAFNSYLQQRGAAVLQASAFLNDDQLSAYFRIAGIAYLFIDKTDPDVPSDLQQRLRQRFPPVFENANTALLGIPHPLGFAFLSRDFIHTGSEEPETAMAALGGAEYNMAMISSSGLPQDQPGLRGRVIAGHIAPREGEIMQEGRPFLPVLKRRATYQRADFEPAGQPGWLVFNEAWHPDWRAFENGKQVPVQRALLAFSAVHTEGKSSVAFEFQQPRWYNPCIWATITAWTTTGIFLLLSTIRRAAKRDQTN